MMRPKADDQTEADGKLEGAVYTSDLFAMIGTLFLWIFWPSFNSALLDAPEQQQRAIMNTYLSLASATGKYQLRNPYHKHTHTHSKDIFSARFGSHFSRYPFFIPRYDLWPQQLEALILSFTFLFSPFFAFPVAVTAFVVSAIVSNEHKLDMVHVQNSTLAGGVAVGSVCNMLIGPHGALLIGFISALISVLGYRYLTVREYPSLNAHHKFYFF